MPDALVGRNETIELWPFSQGEIDGEPDGLVDAMFARGRLTGARAGDPEPGGGSDIVERITRGGFPEAVARATDRRRRFFAAYVEDLVDRDVTQLAEIQRRDQLHRLLRGLASRAGQPLSVSGLAGELGLAATTVERHLSLLEEVFLVNQGLVISATTMAMLSRPPRVRARSHAASAAAAGSGPCRRTVARSPSVSSSRSPSVQRTM